MQWTPMANGGACVTFSSAQTRGLSRNRNKDLDGQLDRYTHYTENCCSEIEIC